VPHYIYSTHSLHSSNLKGFSSFQQRIIAGPASPGDDPEEDEHEELKAESAPTTGIAEPEAPKPRVKVRLRYRLTAY
jgi:hypothetical protein